MVEYKEGTNKSRNTEWYYFQGKASWAKLVKPDLEFKNWNIKVHLKPESYDLFMKLREKDGEIEGILNEVKKDDDGYFVVFKRPMSRKWDGIEQQLTPPIILNSDNEPTQEPIGNGSDVTVKVECYKYNKPFKKGKGKAIRLVSVRVDNLVPYTRKDFTEADEHAIAGIPQQPKQLF